jgi:hypothetical protein
MVCDVNYIFNKFFRSYKIDLNFNTLPETRKAQEKYYKYTKPYKRYKNQ